MKGLSIASVVFVGELTACARADGIDGQPGAGSNSGGLLFLLLVSVVLYCGLVALLWRRASRTGDSFVSRRAWARSKSTPKLAGLHFVVGER
jgi:hypothetical protein